MAAKTRPTRRWTFARVVHLLLTPLFVVATVGAVAACGAFAVVTAIDFAPGSDDKPSSPGVLVAHPELLRAAVVLTGSAVVLAVLLAILDHFVE
jgi:uncharacterized membrane protein YadS